MIFQAKLTVEVQLVLTEGFARKTPYLVASKILQWLAAAAEAGIVAAAEAETVAVAVAAAKTETETEVVVEAVVAEKQA